MTDRDAPGVGSSTPFKVVIPARYGSIRLPGKPLLDIAGTPLIGHVIRRARESRADEVLVATDDERIAAVCREMGADVAMTGSEHRSGSDRIAQVIADRGWESDTIVVNVQGDEPCMPHALIDQVAGDLAGHGSVGMTTLAHRIEDSDTLFDPHVVKVVVDGQGYALYFSRAPVPWHRDELARGQAALPSGVDFFRHIGLYAYRAEFLQRYVSWEPAPLEIAESLEQLRVLWHGERIHVSLATEEPGPGVDTAADLQRVAELLAPGRGTLASCANTTPERTES